MMQQLSITFLFFLFLNFQQLNAQTIVGTWFNPAYEIGLIFKSNQSYSTMISNKEPYDYGTYSIKDKELYLQSQLSGTTAQYTIEAIEENSLTIYDHRALTSLIFIKKEATVVSGKVLATKDGNELKTGHVDIYINRLEFLINGALSQEDKEVIAKETIVQFNEDPLWMLQDAKKLAYFSQTTYASSDIRAIGSDRLSSISDLYHHSKELENSYVVTILNKHCSVVVTSPTDGMLSIDAPVLTQNDLDGFIHYLEFLQVNFYDAKPLNQQQKIQLQQAIIQNFDQLTLEQKKAMGMGALLNTLVQTNWEQLNPDQRQQWKQQYLQQVPLTKDATNNWELSSELEQDKANLEVLNRYLSMTSDTQLQAQITALTILNAIGGSSNYWDVKPY